MKKLRHGLWNRRELDRKQQVDPHRRMLHGQLIYTFSQVIYLLIPYHVPGTVLRAGTEAMNKVLAIAGQ